MNTALLRAALAADIPVLLWGPPGVGKTASVVAEAVGAGAHLEVLIGSTMDPTDLGYLLPRPGELCVDVAPPAWARRLADALAMGRPAWLFLDELSCAPPSVQAALLRVVNERQVAGVDLRGCRIIAAANPADQAAGGWDLAPATANRWLHHQWVFDDRAWSIGMLSAWGRPLTKSEREIRALTVGYLRTRGPGEILAAPSKVGSGAWPSPRTWDLACRFLGALPGKPMEAVGSEIGHAGLAGLVGPEAAVQYLHWLADADLPDPEDVLAGKAGLPRRGDALRAALSTVVNAVLDGRPAQERIRRIEQVITILRGCRPDVALDAAGQLARGLRDAEKRVVDMTALADIVGRVGGA